MTKTEFSSSEINAIKQLLMALEKESDSSSFQAKAIRKKLRIVYGYYIRDLNQQYKPMYDARTKEGLEWLINNDCIKVEKKRSLFSNFLEKKESSSPSNKPNNSSNVSSFPAIVDEQSEILVLGTMPGAESLSSGEYYANSSNIFWNIISDIFNKGNRFSTYADKIACLKANRIAVWDVLACCNRDGSTDKSIIDEQLNDLQAFIKSHPNIKKIVFNGKKPSTYYRPSIPNAIALSTSPANRQYSYEKRIESWREAFQISTIH